MKNAFLQRYVLILLFSLFLPCSSAFGYSTVVTLGDSLSDTGNLGQRYTDGQLWVELVADHYGANLVNRAFAGATTDFDNPNAGTVDSSFLATGLLSQVPMIAPTLASLPPDDTLITLWAGGNDLLQGRDAAAAAANIYSALEDLYLIGGRDFLVPNLPDIGGTPDLLDQGPQLSAMATAWTIGFNSALALQLQNFSNIYNDANLFSLDVFSEFNKYKDEYKRNNSDWKVLFWTDGFHPSSTGHQLISESALAVLVPEPATCLLFTVGIFGIGAFYRNRNRKILK